MALPALVPSENLLGNYRILSRLASGGMGVVYKAFDEKLQRTVALKFLAGESDLSAADRNRLLREARAASALDHENIASIHAIEEAPDGTLFIVMGFYEGENLAMRMSHAPLTVDQNVSVVRQIAQGLAHAHAHNVIHRDIKPSNVILCSDGVAKIVDFGLARVISEDATESIGVSGTLPYMSPEQVTGKSVDHRTDIWSLGVVMYELLTRRHPFPAESPAATVGAIARSQPAPMADIPEALQAIVYRAIAKRPEDRYQSCRELLADLFTWRGCDATASANITAELNGRIARAGSRHYPKSSVKWMIIVLVVLAGLAISYPVQKTLVGHSLGARAMKTTPAAYESYEKGMQFLRASYRPTATESAIAEFMNATRSDPKFALGYVGLGQAYFLQYRLKQDPTLLAQAQSNANIALGINDQLADVYVLLSRLQLSSGSPGLALAQAQRGAELDPQSAAVHLALADIYSAMGRNADADREYEQGIGLDPDSWEGYYRRAMSYPRQQRYEDAARELRHAIALAPDNPYARTNLAVMLKELHREPEAEAELKKALEYDEVFSAYGNLANLYYNQKRLPEAIEMTKKALSLNPKNHTLWNNLAVYYDSLGEKANAEDAYRHEFALLEDQIRLNPRDATMRSDLALQYSRLNIADKAISHIRAALALQPKDTRILQIAGEIYYNVGDRAKGFSYIRKSVSGGNTIEELDRDPDLHRIMTDPKIRMKLQQAEAIAKSTTNRGTK